MFRRFVVVSPLIVALLLSAGCGGALLPRTSAPLPWMAWADSGAMVDASRGHPVAFWADPSREPTEVEVGGATLHPAQWLTHLALRMNEAAGQRTLFDTRFEAIGPTLFKWELASGRYRYTYKAKPEATADLIARSHARAFELRFASAHVVKIGSETGVHILIDVIGGGTKRSYAADSTKVSGWDVDCMDILARRILGDASFWEAAKTH